MSGGECENDAVPLNGIARAQPRAVHLSQTIEYCLIIIILEEF
jgi:hypothetical protein